MNFEYYKTRELSASPELLLEYIYLQLEYETISDDIDNSTHHHTNIMKCIPSGISQMAFQSITNLVVLVVHDFHHSFLL